MRLLVDEMLGRLARWLRLLGHDAAYARDVSDDELLARARAEGRLVVTRDVALAARAERDPGSVLVRSRVASEQLAELEEALGPDLRAPVALSRCSVCNVPLVEATAEEVPAPPAAGPAPRSRCPACGRGYWAGTHFADIRRRLGLGGPR